MELKILLRNTSYLVVTKVIKFIVGIISTKMIAIFLGTLGAGIFAQLSQMTASISQFTLLSMNDGLVKQIAESDRNDRGFNQVLAILIKSYVAIISIVLVFALALSFYFSKELTILFFGNIKYYNYCIIGLASFPILIINSISYAILKGFKQIKYIARSELIVIIINILFFIPLIYIWGLIGAVIYVTFSLLTILIVNHYYAQNIILNNLNISIKKIYQSKISRKSIKELFVFAGIGLTAGVALIFSDTLTRSIVVTQLGINQIGVYSPVITWAGLFNGFILPSIGTYLYPRFSEAKSNYEIIGLLNDAIRFVTLMMIPFLLLSIPIRFQIIPLFYSKQFITAGDYLPWHFLGTLFYLWMFIFSQALTPTGRIKIQGTLVIIICVVDLATVYFLVPIIGLYGWMLKFIISPTLFFIIYFVYFKKAIHFKLEKKNILLMIYILFSFLTSMAIEKYVSSNYKINFLIGLSLTGLSFLMLEKSEKNFILKKIKIR
jgi:O-antigen/teichoic acid export membrane protein